MELLILFLSYIILENFFDELWIINFDDWIYYLKDVEKVKIFYNGVKYRKFIISIIFKLIVSIL